MKTTKRQIKKLKKQSKIDALRNDKIKYLEEKWKRPISYTCFNCLDEAYDCVVNNVTGYITDEELIECSNNFLQHK